MPGSGVSQRTAGMILKGVYSGAVALLGGLAAILTGNATFTDVTDGQWVALVFSALIAFGGTFGLSTWAGPPASGDGGK